MNSRGRAPNRVDWILYSALIFILTYDFPPVWTSIRLNLKDGSELQNPVSYHIFVVLILTAALIYALASIGFDISIYAAYLRKEPLLLIFLLWIASSALWSADPFATTKASFDLIVMALLAVVLVSRFSVAYIVAFGAVASAVATVLHGVFIFFLPIYGVAGDDWKGVTAHKNALGHYSLYACVFFVFCARFFPRFRTINYFFLIGNVVLVLGTGSKTSLVGLVALPVMLMLFKAFRSRKTLYGAIAVAFSAGALTTLVVVGNNIAPIAVALGKDPNLSGRTQLWKASVELVRQRPILGNGFERTFDGWLSPGRYVWQQVGFQLPNAHNAAIQAALDLGLVGAVLLIALLARVIIRSARVLRYLPGSIAMFPLVFAGETLIFGITEAGIINRNIDFLLFSIIVLESTTGRRDALRPSSSPSQSHHPGCCPCTDRCWIMSQFFNPEASKC
jgi:exopolysaccharide production protein ExoQ